VITINYRLWLEMLFWLHRARSASSRRASWSATRRARPGKTAPVSRAMSSILKVLPRVLRNGRADERRLQIATNSRAATIDLDTLAPIGP
jgi:hypothetical protein